MSAPNGGAPPVARPSTLAPQDKNAVLLCRYALSDEAILKWLRGTQREEILQDVAGCELLGLVWKSAANLSDPATLAAYLSQVAREEELAITKLLTQPMPEGGKEAAEHALANLEVTRLNNLLQMLQMELKQPGLTSADLALLQERELALRKEYLDRRGQLQKFSGPTAP